MATNSLLGGSAICLQFNELQGRLRLNTINNFQQFDFFVDLLKNGIAE